jgi:hypothetical protein
MQPPTLAHLALAYTQTPHRWAAREQHLSAPDGQTKCTDDEFIDLLEAYRSSGGLARASEVRVQIGRQSEANLVMLANWIVRRQLICFVWQTRLWLPLFQFERTSMTPKPGLTEVLSEMTPSYADWELAQWFVRAHKELAGQTPAATIAHNPSAVLRVARNDSLRIRH